MEWIDSFQREDKAYLFQMWHLQEASVASMAPRVDFFGAIVKVMLHLPLAADALAAATHVPSFKLSARAIRRPVEVSGLASFSCFRSETKLKHWGDRRRCQGSSGSWYHRTRVAAGWVVIWCVFRWNREPFAWDRHDGKEIERLSSWAVGVDWSVGELLGFTYYKRWGTGIYALSI
jgi:hypothetical protein